MSSKSRVVIYGLVIFLAAAETVVASLTAVFNGVSDLTTPFAWLTVGVAATTCIWTSILLFYNNRPQSKRVFSRGSCHFGSFAIQVIVWPALAVALGWMSRSECRGDAESADGSPLSWCALAASSAAIAGLLSVLVTVASLVVCVSVARRSSSLGINIAKEDEEVEMEDRASARASTLTA